MFDSVNGADFGPPASLLAWFNDRMPSFPTRRQWVVVVLVNIVISAITTILVARVLTRPMDVAPLPISTPIAAATATPRAAVVPTATPAVAPPVAPTPTPQTAGSTPTRPAPTPTSPPAAERANVLISNVNFPGQRQRESVVIANAGDLIDLRGWTLSSPRGVVYTFPAVTLFRDTFINIYTTTGADVNSDLFMNRTEAAWLVGDVVTLSRNGQPVATYTVK